MTTPEVTFDLPIAIDDFTESHGNHPGAVPLLVLFAVLACGGIDPLIDRRRIVFRSPRIAASYRNAIPVELGGKNRSPETRKFCKAMRLLAPMFLGGKSLEEFRDDIERMEAE